MESAPDHDVALRRLRRRAAAVPIASTVAASALSAVPLVAQAPVLPPFGVLMLLAWRLLRPELWPAWIGLPLGLADDLLTGRPLGTAMAAWTVILLLIEAGEDRMVWRGRREEWSLAAFGAAIAMFAAWATTTFTGSPAPLRLTLVPLAAGILVFPAVQHMCAALDRWRLRG